MVSRKVRRNVLLVVGILIVILLIVIFSIIYNSPDSIFSNKDNRVTRVDNVNEYYNVQTCVKKFYELYKDVYYGENFYENLTNEEFKQRSLEILYNMLDKEYIEKYSITKDNLSEKVGEVLNATLQINDIYRIKKNDDIAMYIVYSEQVDNVNNKIEDLNLMVKIDSSRNTFGILLDNYIVDQGFNNIKENQKYNIELSNILANSTNKFTGADIDQVTYVENMFEDYRYSMMYNRNRAYSLVNEETKNNKFNTFDSYNNYIKDNIKSIVIMEIKTYKVNEQEKYTDYEYVDTYGNQYTFRVTSPMKYTVIMK